jgi:hypothetical protein
MKNLNWKKIMQWLTIIIAAIGGNQAVDYATAEDQAPTSYEAPALSGSTWTVVAWIVQEKQAGGGATPAVKYTDNMGRYTIFVDKIGKPTKEEILNAFDPALDPAGTRLNIVQIIKPDGGTEPDEPADK